jgi:hypothetical protein
VPAETVRSIDPSVEEEEIWFNGTSTQRDLFAGCTGIYYELFYFLEDEGILEVDNVVHR